MYATQVDLTTCDREPIHIPGSIQPHGFLLLVEEPSLRVIQLSQNAAQALNRPAEEILRSSLASLLNHEDLAFLQTDVLNRKLDRQHFYIPRIRGLHTDAWWSAVVHRWDGLLFLELQREEILQDDRRSSIQALVRKAITDLDTCESVASFCQAAAGHFRNLTGIDRVMVYRFLEDGSGIVIAESLEDGLSPYLGLRYPASDIPAQARRLYILNPFRLTADVNAPPVPMVPPVNPKTGAPLDMSYCALRATSPVHLQYLRNMGVSASLSFSIVRGETLWGLIACHHTSPKLLNQETRIAGEILSRLIGLQVREKEETEQKQYVSELRRVRIGLGERLRESGDFVTGLVTPELNLLTGIRAAGVALSTGTRIVTLGRTPSTEQISGLCDWILKQDWEPVWSSNKLSSLYPPAKDFAQTGSGVLVLRVAAGSPEAVIWFRPEVIEDVHWAGNPNKPAEADANGTLTLNPRHSFELWKEQVRGQSPSWQPAETNYALELYENMSQALLQHRAGEISRLNAELMRTNEELQQFASIASHDLQEPLRTINIYTQLLFGRQDFSNNPDASEMVGFIKDATARMSRLVKSLLEFAQLGRRSGRPEPISAAVALGDALADLESRIKECQADIKWGDLPTVLARREELTRVFLNLISNALKYSRADEHPTVHVQAERRGKTWMFSVHDNGTGFDPAHAEEIFQSFRRLHGREYKGTGLGLSICKKIIESFGGSIWAESQIGVGSTFFFTIPAASAMAAGEAAR